MSYFKFNSFDRDYSMLILKQVSSVVHQRLTIAFKGFATAWFGCAGAMLIARVTGMISRLAGASPAMAFGRREHVDEGKGVRRNVCLLPDEGTTVNR